ncbi:TauD/TfdA family dioxygenase [Sneathiella aquimaris]|uniref:TauD/TfdA family dioxygenase n=1 Tax=Sneathiella aquimaris TaxID=2599305 RepID=UPI00146CDF13|nr:TauD/TfdA family dioxygenase [Sneathiella aquimaris]
MAGYMSFRDQSRHYFDRPHEGPATEPVKGEAAWTGDTLRSSESWIETFSQEEISEINAALDFSAQQGKATNALGPSDFPLPLLSEKIQKWQKVLRCGRGFQVLRGLPVDDWGAEKAERFFWCFGLHLGRPGAQNAAGDLLGHVIDTGAAENDPLSRLYKTASKIKYHCDGADIVGLLCLNKAKSGGQSRIVSSVTVFNRLLESRPDLAALLFESRPLDIRNESKSGARSHIRVTPCAYAKGRLSTFYHADYFRSVVRHADVPAFSEIDQQLLDYYERIAADPALYLDMDLEPGDIQLLSNHTNLHARTDYIDQDDPAERRHLLRLWLSLE